MKKPESRLGGSPLDGMDDLLSPTVDIGKPGQGAKNKEVRGAVKTETKNRPEKPVAPKPRKAKKPEASAEEENKQFGYENQIKWPLLPKLAPYMVAVPKSGDKVLSTAFSMRLPLDLDLTIDAHCRSMRANRSEWVREAMERLLAEEQAILKAK